MKGARASTYRAFGPPTIDELSASNPRREAAFVAGSSSAQRLVRHAWRVYSRLPSEAQARLRPTFEILCREVETRPAWWKRGLVRFHSLRLPPRRRAAVRRPRSGRRGRRTRSPSRSADGDVDREHARPRLVSRVAGHAFPAPELPPVLGRRPVAGDGRRVRGSSRSACRRGPTARVDAVRNIIGKPKLAGGWATAGGAADAGRRYTEG